MILPEEKIGLNQPVSTDFPSSEQRDLNVQFEAWIDFVSPGESEEGFLRRWRALVDLEDFVSEWIMTLKDLKVTSKNPARVLTFGSFRLGVINSESDMDALVMLPLSVQRDRFFTDFPIFLSKISGITECNAVSDARVPVVKLKFRSFYFDILMARVPDKILDSNLIDVSNLEAALARDCLDDNLIFNLDEKCMKSMNGVRVADKIISLVPDPQNFRLATRCVKYWAQQRCIYSNAIGYVGGVSWALMVGKICQMYPYATPFDLVKSFFRYYATLSNWHENPPIQLGPVLDWNVPNHLKSSQFREWNPQKYSADGNQPLPIVTPIFPCHNTAYNVTESQKWVILTEIGRAFRLFESDAGLDQIFSLYDFFGQFKKFMVLELSATSDLIFLKFKGLVESRIRSLVKALEDQRVPVFARPHQDFFKSDDLKGCFYLGIWTDAPENQERKVDMTEAIRTFYLDTIQKSLLIVDWYDPHKCQVAIHIKVVTRGELSASPQNPEAKRMRAD
jgi:poly(A) polymerase